MPVCAHFELAQPAARAFKNGICHRAAYLPRDSCCVLEAYARLPAAFGYMPYEEGSRELVITVVLCVEVLGLAADASHRSLFEDRISHIRVCPRSQERT